MASVQAVAGGHVGYVRAVFSHRCRGFALPVDLVRANLRAVVRVSVRRRVAAEFAGYLVTDSCPGVLPLFSQHRAAHEYGILSECVTGAAGVGFFGSNWGKAGGPIDAPRLMPAGSMLGADFGGVSAVVERGAWVEAQEVPAAVPSVWREASGRVVVLGLVFSGRGMAGDDSLLQDEFAGALHGAAIDAPIFLLSGSMQAYDSNDGERCAKVGRFWRDGE
jgi:hypothetical protein